MTETATRTRAAPSRIREILARGASIERVIYAAIVRAIVRKPWKHPQARGFDYHAQSLTVLIVFLALSAVELVVIDLIVHPWPWVRFPLLALGIWGLVWMTGLLCAHFMRPHTVGPDGIRVRNGMDLDAHVAWADVHSVEIAARSHEPKTPLITKRGDGDVLTMHVTDMTNIDIVLERPTPVRVPGVPPRGGERIVSRLSLWTDDPKGYLGAVRDFIDA